MFEIFSSSTRSMTNSNLGQWALLEFHNASLAASSKYKISFTDLLSTFGSAQKQANFLENFGKAIRKAEMEDLKVKAAMRNLALASNGKIPAMPSDYFNALIGEVQNVSFVDAVKDSAEEFSKDLAEVGGGVITTVKTLGALLPIVAVAAILFIVYSRTKQLAGK